jgi:metallo-beta-lactamase class B
MTPRRLAWHRARKARRLAILMVAGLAGLLAPLAAVRGQTQAQQPDWNRPVEPFRAIGNIYYVGTNELAAFLLTTSDGHILIDGGLPESAALIETSIEKLGFKVTDVKILLTTQAHFDHVGSLAELAARSGGQVMVMAGDAELVERGGRGDYLFGDRFTFTPAKVGRVLHDGDTVGLGGTSLVAHQTPGHTPGCTTWTTAVREGGRTYSVVFVGSTTVNQGTRLVKHPSYPGIRADYERSFRVLGGMHPDVFFGAHTGFFGLEGKRARLEAGAASNPFVDPEGYAELLARMERRFHEAVAAEQ